MYYVAKQYSIIQKLRGIFLLVASEKIFFYAKLRKVQTVAITNMFHWVKEKDACKKGSFIRKETQECFRK